MSEFWDAQERDRKDEVAADEKTRRERHGVIGPSDHGETIMSHGEILAAFRRRLDQFAATNSGDMQVSQTNLRFLLDAADSIPLGADGQLVTIDSQHWALGDSGWERVTVLEFSRTEAYIDGWATRVDVSDLHSQPPKGEDGA